MSVNGRGRGKSAPPRGGGGRGSSAGRGSSSGRGNSEVKGSTRQPQAIPEEWSSENVQNESQHTNSSVESILEHHSTSSAPTQLAWSAGGLSFVQKMQLIEQQKQAELVAAAAAAQAAEESRRQLQLQLQQAVMANQSLVGNYKVGLILRNSTIDPNTQIIVSFGICSSSASSSATYITNLNNYTLDIGVSGLLGTDVTGAANTWYYIYCTFGWYNKLLL